MQKPWEIQGAGAESRPVRDWQRDWFATPGDLDDFIFYDETRDAQEQPDP